MTIKDEIAKLAYELYKKRMGKDGKELDDWLKAERIILSRYKCRKHLGIIMMYVSTIATAVMALVMILQMGSLISQTASLRKQTDVIGTSFEIEKRPYLYVDITPAKAGYDKDHNLFAGVLITYKNAGSIVANDVVTDVMIADDGDRSTLRDIAQWYKDTYKSYPYIKSVFPQQKIDPIKFTPNISDFPHDKAKLIYVGVRITYSGYEGKKYSYGVDYIYMLRKISEEELAYTVIKYDTFWDSNTGLMPNSIEAPDWNLYAKG